MASGDEFMTIDDAMSWLFAQTLGGATTAAIELNGAGSVYTQSFDQLGSDGEQIGTTIPDGWTHGRFGKMINTSFPVEENFSTHTLFNAGAPGSADRTLAVGRSSSNDNRFLQLLAQVTGTSASSIQVQFDLEAWDSRDGIFVPILNRYLATPDDPGEAAFNVLVEMNRGTGFELLTDLGNVTTGANLQPIRDGLIDGNADENRFSFDSGPIEVHIPADAELRIRWQTTDSQSTGWVYGLDNVALTLGGASELRRRLQPRRLVRCH